MVRVGSIATIRVSMLVLGLVLGLGLVLALVYHG